MSRQLICSPSLALTRSLQGQGLGTDLLLDALSTIVQASETGAGRIIVVNAIDQNAAEFYMRHNLKPVQGSETDDGDQRLVIKVATVRKALGIASVKFTPSPGTRLGSIVLRAPDGRAIPAIVTLTGLEAVMNRLSGLAENASVNAGHAIDLNHMFLEVLGRNPLTESD